MNAAHSKSWLGRSGAHGGLGFHGDLKARHQAAVQASYGF